MSRTSNHRTITLLRDQQLEFKETPKPVRSPQRRFLDAAANQGQQGRSAAAAAQVCSPLSLPAVISPWQETRVASLLPQQQMRIDAKAAARVAVTPFAGRFLHLISIRARLAWPVSPLVDAIMPFSSLCGSALPSFFHLSSSPLELRPF